MKQTEYTTTFTGDVNLVITTTAETPNEAEEKAWELRDQLLAGYTGERESDACTKSTTRSK